MNHKKKKDGTRRQANGNPVSPPLPIQCLEKRALSDRQVTC